MKSSFGLFGKEAAGSEKLHRLWFIPGLMAVLIKAVPWLLLGENAIFTYHDQLDGELIAYILQARNLFRGGMLPEFMGGMSKTALTLPAPGFVLLFLSGDYFAALLSMLMIGSVTGYFGMYLLEREIGVHEGIAAITAVLFAYLPFLPVYGLTQYGIPLLFWCVLQLKKKRHMAAAYLYTAFYALTSSLVLLGFGLLGMGMLWMAWLFWKQRECVLSFLGAWLLLLGIYIAENCRLLEELLGLGGAQVSHKSEYVLAGGSFFPLLWQKLTEGSQHSEDYHLLLLAAALFAVAVGFALREKRVRRMQCIVGICLLWNLFFAFTAAFWDSDMGINIRNSMGVLRAFQLDRLMWVAPVFWYLIFACGAMICMEFLMRREKKPVMLLLTVLLTVVVGGSAAGTGLKILLAGDVKSNIQKLRNPDYGLLSYRDYYAIGVMEQVEDFLRETEGKEQQEYRVVSLGIDPAAALYHGFYCLDGYSNNYSLDYKHRFRRVLAPELERNEYLSSYFDSWGNRCYLFSSECPGYYTIEKGAFCFWDFRLDKEALKEMGGDYLLSAAYIVNGAEQGLVLLNETPLETEDSYYKVYIYKVI